MANQLVGSELRKGSGFARKGEGFQLILGETWNFRVKTDGVISDRRDVLYNTPGLPRAGLIYDALGLVCDEVTCDREEKHAQYWNVTARFQTGSEQQKQSPDNPDSPDPTTWIPVFRAEGFTTKKRVIAFDKTTPTAKKATNSAGTPFDDPLTEDRTLCNFGGVQFEDPGLTLKAIMDRNETVNNASITLEGESFSARTLLLNVEEAEKGSFAGYQAWRIKYKLTYDPDTHDEIRLDVGPYYLDGGVLKRYMDDQNQFGIIGGLNGSGARTTTPAELNFRVKKPISFSFLRGS
jgi:hypothetical protein